MRIRVAATAVMLLAALTACGGGDGSPTADTKPSAVETPGGESTSGQVEEGMKLGVSAQTVGDGGEGTLEITPDTIVFTTEGGGETSENGTFVVVTMKDKATSDVAADEPAPITGGGWKWMAADGEMLDSGGGAAFNVVMDKYNNADPVQPGSYQWRAQVFDLTEAQAKGGTLIYIDGEEKAHRWQMPSEDTGPNVDEVKKQLEF